MSDRSSLAWSLSKALIAASVPRGMRRAGSQQEWLCGLKGDPEVLGLRYDGYANLLRVANLIVWGADWSTMCSRPTIAKIVEVTGLAKPTVKRWVRWLRVRGWLGVVEQGSTVKFRKGTYGGLCDDGFGNRAAVWVLCVPRRPFANDQRFGLHKRTSEPPSFSLPERKGTAPTRAGETPRRRFRDHSRISPTWHLHATPRTKRDRLAACERLRQESPVLRLMTAWYLRWLLKPFLEAGATVADVLHALDVREDDSRWTYTWSSTAEIRHPAGWVRHRLAAWTGPDGQVLPLPSQRRAAVDARRRAEQEERRQEWARMAAVAGWVPAPRPAAEPIAAAAGLETVEPQPAAPAAGPTADYRAARAELERRSQEKEAAEEAMIAAWRARRSG
ncbi:hypothetical protein [Nonomuraea diastatica]|uniref:Helix-turn-helix domain-containing protein n=1 Tax=Nonomuraea diastatica TaxID=1848329 RepID=A0A4V2YAI3_9ACTN|nr:hypothetical protein [Nonomuraea diastatica]TDD03846.1 hypothetical protein E1294_50490 [Nonomuraea diastatica]